MKTCMKCGAEKPPIGVGDALLAAVIYVISIAAILGALLVLDAVFR